MSPIVSSHVKNPELVRERRAQIIAAAVRLFSEKGFHRTTTREIAKASGMSNGAIYEYVKSKEDILYLVCKRIHESVEGQLRDSLIEDEAGADRLAHAIRAFLSVVDAMKDDILLIYQESKSLPKPFLHEVLSHEERITKVFEQLVRDGVGDGSLTVADASIPLLAHNIVVCGQMWAYRRWALQDVSFDAFVDVQVEMLMQACGRN